MDPVVRLRSGQLRGYETNGVCAFLGVPYAAAPTGDDRFRVARPVPRWDGVRAGVQFGATAPQPGFSAPFDRLLPNPVIAGEEYLNLNVWTPKPARSGLPVMVWIHGGAFVHGSNAMPWYDGTAFARNGVVLVSVNYRLGAPGFCLLPDAPANLGLRDQLAALSWVQQNITAFGGDPARVTIFGQSAGGMCVAALMSAPAACGLFRQAIVQSGAMLLLAAEDARLVAADLANRLGVAPTATGLGAIPAETLIAAQDALIADLARDPNPARWGTSVVAHDMAFLPVLDGELLTAPPIDAIAAGAGRDITLLVGTTLEEMRLFLVPTGAAAAMTTDALPTTLRQAGWDPSLLHVYAASRPDATPGDLWAAISTDAYYRAPGRRLAEAHGHVGGTSYLYEFCWRTPAEQLGACHSVEIPFVFKTIAEPSARPLLGNKPPQALADRMHAAWVHFARYGRADWPAYDLSSRAVMSFDHPSCKLTSDPRSDERTVWTA